MTRARVLFFAADPLSAMRGSRTPRLLLDEDLRQIRQKVRAAEHRDALDFDVRWAARTDDLLQALNETRPRVVHFSGHGTSEGLVLVSADGRRPHPVDAPTLARLFQVFRGDIQVVVLNACFSLSQAQAIAQVVGCAIGTRAAISDAAAITFGASFYRAIAFGHSVQAAFDQASLALQLEHGEHAHSTELVVRDGVDPARLVLVGNDGKDGEDDEGSGAGGGAPAGAELVSIARLPVTRPDVFGRDRELALLDEAWASAGTNVAVITAWGGVGKTALVNRWMAGMAGRGYAGARKVFAWSFYSQGAQERGASADLFIETALAELGDPDPPTGSPWSKAQRLVKQVRAHRALLVLDGLEVLQFPPGPQEGRLSDRAVAALLTELAASNPGLCVLTSRAAPADLAVFEGDTVLRLDLENLAPQAGVRLLVSMGVRPGDGGEGEMETAVASFAGHALALTLLGGYLADVHGGDIAPWREVGPLQDEQRMGEHARRVMRAYERWLGEGHELAVLRLVSLFDRPAQPGAVQALRDPPPVAGLTDDLPRGRAWRETLARLRRAALLYDPNPAEPDTLDAHPLVRDYFGEQLRLRAPGAWRAGNERLYHYLAGSAPELPATLAEMAPLYSAVSHGREAGLAEEAYQQVYCRRIQRDTYFAFRTLGSAALDLACLSRFFASPWEELKPGLEPYSQVNVLNQAGVFLRAVGRLPEAIQATAQATALRVARGEWKEAVLNATNLAEMAVLVGDLHRARSAAAQSLPYADQSADALSVVISRSALAAVLHQLGRMDEALELFAQAEARERARGLPFHILYSLRGFQYGDCLLDAGRLDEVVERARTTRGWAEERTFLMDMGLSDVLLARVSLARGDAAAALEHVNRAVDLLHAADALHHLLRARLVCAAVHRALGRWEDAGRELDLVQRHSLHLGLRPLAADGELERGWLRYAQGDPDAARTHLATAEDQVLSMGYGRRRDELALLRDRLASG